MASLRETKNRIKSVKNTEKITKAMKMVAASKLRRAQEAVVKPRSFAQKLASLMSSLASKAEVAHPLLIDRTNKNHVCIIALASDRGLCGSLNSSIIRSTTRFIFDNQDNFKKISVATIGRKVYEGLSKEGVNIFKHYPPKEKVYDFFMAKDIAEEMCQKFLSEEFDGVYLIYNQFKSAISQTIAIEQMLPVNKNTLTDSIDFIYEPNQEELLNALIPRHFAMSLYQAFLESYASEQGARMTAMDNATRNAKEMTEKLTLQYNRARQAAITKELMEIIGGAEAL